MNEPMASISINRYGPTVPAQVWGQEYYALKGEWGFMLLCIPSECPLGVFLYQFEESGYE